ncbi:nucleoside 2-deoxyribosyltransferase [Corynebacterium sp. AOP40-9SA-29]|uniref:nucleoside 2-deoxyribosyltransferase n=1 Tax=Corynebacterium sp. AOP40-9SA-29 TaxID=3457677 RepID=UPI004034E9E4
MSTQEYRVYLAGPEVFLPDAADVVARMQQVCRDNGLTPIAPLDAGLDETAAPEPAAPDATRIFDKNIAKIHSADAVIANVNHFRGAEPDSGTCFELGFAHALGKKLYVYSEGATTVERVERFHGPVTPGERPTDPEGRFVEDFGFAVNLMMAVPATNVAGSFADAVRAVAVDLRDDA